LLLLQMHVYAACDDPDIQAAVRARYKHLWELMSVAVRKYPQVARLRSPVLAS
jgi:hypothetical protein